jgi:hypothetical protein
MAKIKVTGYLYLDDDEVDTNDSSGLTEAAYLEYSNRLLMLDDLQFKLVDPDDED